MSKHVHKYKRFTFPSGKKRGFRCMLPACSHYVFEAMLVGKKSLCWRCGNEFIIDEASAKLLKPHCNCKKRSTPENEIIDNLTAKIIDRARQISQTSQTSQTLGDDNNAKIIRLH